MNSHIVSAVFLPLAVGLVVFLRWIEPAPPASYSIPLHLAACGITFYIYFHWRDRRVIPLGVLFLAAAACRGAELLHEGGAPEGSIAARVGSFAPIVLSIAVVYAVYFLSRVLADTDRLRILDEALTRSEERYRTLAKQVPVITYMSTFDDRDTSLHVSPQIEKTLGYSVDEFKTSPDLLRSLLHPDDRRTVLDEVHRCCRSGEPFSAEFRLVARDGREVWFRDEAAVIKDGGRDAPHLHGVMFDITRLKMAEKEAREAEVRYRTLFDRMRDSLSVYEIVYDDAGKACDLLVLEVNDAYEKLTGRAQARVVGRLISEISPDLSPFWIEELAHVAETGESKRIELYEPTVSKNIEVEAFRPRAGRCALVSRDVTERKNLEEQLRKATRMEAIGQLAGGIAHDFNNLLTGILGYANIIKLESEPGSSFNEAAETIELAAERAAELTRQLLGFARKGKYRIVPVDLHETVHDTVALLSSSFDKKIRIELDLDARNATVMGDPGQLQQTLLNLAVNARDAMPDGGILSFRTEVVPAGRSGDDAGGESLQLFVMDTGSGIPAEVMERIFEPFFSTKGVGKGTGMGLAMVYGIVANHGGSIDVESREGEGATFRLRLPLALKRRAAPKVPPPSAPAGGAPRILLVDDEKLVREVAIHMLRSMDFEVVAACDGKEAVAEYCRQEGAFDLVLLDMVMPEMGGRECFHALREFDPYVRAVLSTGYGLEGPARELLDEGMLGFVQKPYCLDQLRDVITEALARPAGAPDAVREPVPVSS